MKARFLLLSLILSTTSCAFIYNQPEDEVVSCPIVEIEEPTSVANFYNSKIKSDESLLYSINLLGHKTECRYNIDYSSVQLMISPTFNIKVNDNFQDNKLFIDYFVAIPKMFPDPDGRKLLTTKAKRPKGLVRFNFTDDVLLVNIPINNGEIPSKYKLIIGLQLTMDQFKENKNYK